MPVAVTHTMQVAACMLAPTRGAAAALTLGSREALLVVVSVMVPLALGAVPAVACRLAVAPRLDAVALVPASVDDVL